MDVFIYFPLDLEIPRDEIEDAIQERLGERGEVTGGGAGMKGSNLDVEVFDEDSSVVAEIEQVLRDMKVPPATKLVVDGREKTLGKA